MLFKTFCERVEDFKTPTEARKQVLDLFSLDDPLLVCMFLMGQPLGSMKLKISTKTVNSLITKYGIDYTQYENPGEAIKNIIDSESKGLSLSEVESYYYHLATHNNKEGTLNYILVNYFDDLERKVFVNILLDKFQNKVGWGVIKYSLSEFFNEDVTKVDAIYKRTNSIEKTISILQGFEENEGIFYPINSQLSKEIKLDKLKYPVFGEPKIDGFRAQVHVKNGLVSIFSGRNIDSIKTGSFPDVVFQVKNYSNGIYDGEIVGFRNGKMYSFTELQHRINLINPTEKDIEDYPVKFIVFDLLHDGNEFILNKMYLNRRLILSNKIDEIICSFLLNNIDDAIKFYERCINAGYEGIVLKTLNGCYYPGEGKTGHKEWYKYKPAKITYDCVITNAKYGTGKNKDVLASFEVSVLDEDLDPIENEFPLRPIGWVGTGFSDSDLEALTCRIAPFGVIPSYEEFNDLFIVIEVKADCFLKDACRFLRFVAIRDKKEINSWADLQ